MAEHPYPLMRLLLRALRTKRGLTQEQLAERAGISYKYYQQVELGMFDSPSLATLEKLSRALGVKPWVLLCDETPLLAKRTGVTNLGQRVAARPGRPRKPKIRLQ